MQFFFFTRDVPGLRGLSVPFPSGSDVSLVAWPFSQLGYIFTPTRGDFFFLLL